jgi:hypothetical protein
MFYDLGWLHPVCVENESHFDEETRRQCDEFNNSDFLFRFVADQVSCWLKLSLVVLMNTIDISCLTGSHSVIPHSSSLSHLFSTMERSE